MSATKADDGAYDNDAHRQPAPPAYSDVAMGYPSADGPLRGVLASRGRLWDTAQWRQASARTGHGQVHIHVLAPYQRREPGPPGPPHAVVQAHRYKCSVCGFMSFVRREDVGPYIKCPHCQMNSATNQPATRKRAILFLVGGLLALLAVLGAFISFPIIMSSSSSSSSHGENFGVTWAIIALVLIVAFVSMSVLCTCSTVYFRVPVSTIYAEQVPYQLSQEEYATMPL